MRTALFIISVLLIACNSGSDQEKSEQTAALQSAAVRYSGALKLMMHQGDITAKADLDSLRDMEHLYALGAVAELKGEILILDGKAFIAAQQDSNLNIDNSFDHQASLLVYAAVSNWKEADIPESVTDGQSLERFIETTAFEQGIDTAKAFPFMLLGVPQQIDWHVINWQEGDTIHSHEKHVNSGLNGSLYNTEMKILGFYSRHHHAIFTHHSTNAHMHFLTADKSISGHVDYLIPGEEMKLLLPN